MLDKILNSDQQICVNFDQGVALVLATAGSGKTRVIIERFRRLVNSGINKDSILCITFSNKAAEEISQRLNEYAGWVGTFHGISFKLLQMYDILPSKTVVIDENDKKDIFIDLRIISSLDVISKAETAEKPIHNADILEHYEIYKSYCKDNNLIDFNQILNLMLDTLKSNEQFCKSVANRFKYIMVDEFQDSSRKQLDILSLINTNNMMCVGDDYQAIYGWRGACVDNVINFSKIWPNSKVFHLNRNYRSTIPIVQAAGSITKRITNGLDKNMWTDKQGPKVEVYSSRNEYTLIANKIVNIPKDKNIAVLLRSVHQLSSLENVFVNAEIPYQTIIGNKFLDRSEIRDVLACLRCLFMNDKVSLKRMFSKLGVGVGPKRIELILQDLNAGIELLDAIFNLLGKMKRYELIEKITSWKTETNPRTIIERIWFESKLSEIHSEKDIDLLLNKASNFSTIDEFLRNVITLDSDEMRQTVVMTIHSAKGLEFDYVFIPGVFDGNIPHANAIINNSLDEERRVLNVAMTRAKEYLCITYNPSDRYRDYFGISRFLLNLPREYVEFFNDEIININKFKF